PKPRDYSYKVPKKVRRLALYSVLTSKLRENELVVLDELKFDNYKTKEALEVLNNVDAVKKSYVVIDESDDKVYRSFKNIEGVDVQRANVINVYDLMRHNKLVIAKDAIAKLEEVFI